MQAVFVVCRLPVFVGSHYNWCFHVGLKWKERQQWNQKTIIRWDMIIVAEKIFKVIPHWTRRNVGSNCVHSSRGSVETRLSNRATSYSVEHIAYSNIQQQEEAETKEKLLVKIFNDSSCCAAQLSVAANLSGLKQESSTWVEGCREDGQKNCYDIYFFGVTMVASRCVYTKVLPGRRQISVKCRKSEKKFITVIVIIVIIIIFIQKLPEKLETTTVS